MPRRASIRGFTLIEILLSVLIITMLMLLGFATNRALRNSAKQRQAALEVRAIEQAMLSYRQIYGTWPLTADKAPSEIAVSNVLAVLCNDIPDTADQEMKDANPRGIVFLEFKGTENASGARYLDPFGNRYMIGVRWDDGESYQYAFYKDCYLQIREYRDLQPDTKPVMVWSLSEMTEIIHSKSWDVVP